MATKGLFVTNPFDIECFFDSVEMAEDFDMHYVFIDHFIEELKENKDVDIVDLCYRILLDTGIIENRINKRFMQNDEPRTSERKVDKPTD